MTVENTQATATTNQRNPENDTRIAMPWFVPLVIIPLVVGVGLYYLNKQQEESIRTGEFERAMSPEARTQYQNKAKEINENIKSLNESIKLDNPAREKQLRQELALQYKDLATIVERDYANIVKNNPTMGDTAKALAKTYDSTSKNITKQKGFLNQISDDSNGARFTSTIASDTITDKNTLSKMQAQAIITSMEKEGFTGNEANYLPGVAKIALGLTSDRKEAESILGQMPGVDTKTAQQLVNDAAKQAAQLTA
jgi:hypothetical protein